MFTIENEILKAVIQPRGAELVSLYNKETQLEYIWKGDPAFWGKHSPVLFPIVGTLKENAYIYNDQTWHLSRHGFAREKPFAVESHTSDTIYLSLYDDEESRKVFPFHFCLEIKYTLYRNALAVAYQVSNTGKEVMYFSLGAHPAFSLPMDEQSAYEDYYLEFEKEENAPRWPISPDGLIEKEPIPLLRQTQRLPLSKTLFHKDALVMKNLSSSIVRLKSDSAAHGLQFDFPGFNYLGLWAAKDADFICIEPWCGIADSVDANQRIEEKEGINKLPPTEKFARTWTVSLY